MFSARFILLTPGEVKEYIYSCRSQVYVKSGHKLCILGLYKGDMEAVIGVSQS